MKNQLDPELIEFVDPSPINGICIVAYCGFVVPGMYRTPEIGAGAPTQRYYLAREIEERIEAMSAHQRLAFHEATRTR